MNTTNRQSIRQIGLGLLPCLMPVDYFLDLFSWDGEATVIQVIDFSGLMGWIGIIGLVLFFYSHYPKTNFASTASPMRQNKGSDAFLLE